MQMFNEGNASGQLNAPLKEACEQHKNSLFTVATRPKVINGLQSSTGSNVNQMNMMQSVTRVPTVPKTQFSQMSLTPNPVMTAASYGTTDNSISIRANSNNSRAQFAQKMSISRGGSRFQSINVQPQATSKRVSSAIMSMSASLKAPPKPQSSIGIYNNIRYVDQGTTLTGMRYGGSRFTKPRTSVTMNGCVLDEPSTKYVDYDQYKKMQDLKRIPNSGEEPQTSQYLLEDVQFQLLGSRGCLRTDRKHSQDEVRLTDISNVTEKGINFGHALTLREALEDINSKRVVFFGEEQGIKEIVQMETVLAMAMLARYQEPKDQKLGPILNIVMEPFTFDQQHILDEFQSGQLTIEQLFDEYVKTGSTQCYKIRAYRELLEFSQQHSNLIKLHAGFMPHSFLNYLETNGEADALQLAQQHNYIPNDVTQLESSDLHYNMYESLVSQRNMYDKDLSPSDQYQNKFKQSLFQDYAMTYQLNKIIQTARAGSKFLVIAQESHTKHFQGVPGMLLKQNQVLKSHTATILASKSNENFQLGLPPKDYNEVLVSQYGEAGMNPADYIYLYKQNHELDEDATIDGKQVIQIVGGPKSPYENQIIRGKYDTRVDESIIRTDFTDKDLKIQINYFND